MLRRKLKLLKNLRPEHFLYVFLALIALATIAVVRQVDNESIGSPGQSYVAGQSRPKDAYKSLDLRIASQAIYPSSPIQVVKDMGVENNVHLQIIHFDVKDDGLVESALLALPTTPKPSTGYPVIVLCHGYVNPLYYSTEKAYLPDVDFYAQHGYAVVKPDYRGQGHSLGHGSPDGAYYSMAYNTDVMSLISAIKQSPKFNKKNINLWGHSMGAYIALRASVLSPDIKNTFILSGPVGYINDMYSSYVAISDANNAVAADIRAKELSAHGTPADNLPYWQNASPLNFLSRSRSFYQIHVGTADKIVPPHFSDDLVKQLKKDSVAYEYYVYNGGDHGLMGYRTDYIWPRTLNRLSR
jgi:dipeptidyl aminopeptidase/acylaminoacyl peptidase